MSTILEETEPPEKIAKLRKWQHKQDKIHGIEKSAELRTQTLDQGTLVHEAIASYLKGEIQGYPHPLFNQALPLLSLLKSEKNQIEQNFYSWSNQPYTGTYDLLTKFNDQLTLLDWKTSKRIKKRQWLDTQFTQTAAYAQGAEAVDHIKITQLAIIIISPEKLQIFTEDRGLPDYQWEQRLNQFYKTYTLEKIQELSNDYQ